ncbi:MAG: phosphate acetyltransferase [Bacteroidetes bacterium GWF2_42_66]|nr:MAG: phosphate acetyltransferase [Bacteroidetes bacterium GWA2_42_15]OFX98624.1 MAG: phosphate acetyltransferase [Bacteroidetes bacterium GWE2_42_39]OFY43179.1 MAG: phosphate acetyltransferase [Bacteroidetes bacterium GWF2_42_66]HBL76968.1 phosphate acetyltransferase [Prolixibacteraceae bacterium]HCU59977.1 phosphate acetyltransferase [Prolixibacteraceae bacterium]
MDLLKKVIENAKIYQKRIVLPEGAEPRTLRATEIIIQQGIAQIILLGDPVRIKKVADECGVSVKGATVINPATDERRGHYADKMVEIRKEKGLTKEQALKLLDDPLYFAPMMIKSGDADGELAGAINSTGDVLRPALQYIKTLPGVSVVSGAFVMFVNDPAFGHDGVLVFADCAVMPDPTDRQLAEIAVTTAKTARAIVGLEPRVAMLSFSTKGSAQHPLVDKVASATKIAKEIDPDLMIDGELQLDAALVPEVGQLKSPGSNVAGKANILVFPGLESANIGYKLVQRLAKAEAVGPVLQGMAAPINDLSRGCSVSDIVNMVAVTANQAAAIFK